MTIWTHITCQSPSSLLSNVNCLFDRMWRQWKKGDPPSPTVPTYTHTHTHTQRLPWNTSLQMYGEMQGSPHWWNLKRACKKTTVRTKNIKKPCPGVERTIRDAMLRYAVRNTLRRAGRFNHAATDCSDGGGVRAQLPTSLITQAAPGLLSYDLSLYYKDA